MYAALSYEVVYIQNVSSIFMQFIYTYINTITYINILNWYSTFKNILLENFNKKQILSRALHTETNAHKQPISQMLGHVRLSEQEELKYSAHSIVHGHDMSKTSAQDLYSYSSTAVSDYILGLLFSQRKFPLTYVTISMMFVPDQTFVDRYHCS